MTVFVQGCPHHCPGCHNPETHDFKGGYIMPCETILQRIRANPLLSGVTFSGGEPFCQAAALIPLGEKIKELGLELAIYTGYTWEELVAEIRDEWMRLLRLADILVDGRFRLEQRSLDLKFRGSANQRILDVRKSLAAGRAVLDSSARWNGRA